MRLLNFPIIYVNIIRFADDTVLQNEMNKSIHQSGTRIGRYRLVEL